MNNSVVLHKGPQIGSFLEARLANLDGECCKIFILYICFLTYSEMHWTFCYDYDVSLYCLLYDVIVVSQCGWRERWRVIKIERDVKGMKRSLAAVCADASRSEHEKQACVFTVRHEDRGHCLLHQPKTNYLTLLSTCTPVCFSVLSRYLASPSLIYPCLFLQFTPLLL